MTLTAQIAQTTWKRANVQRVEIAVLKLALARNGREFSANDLPDSLVHGGVGIAGTVFGSLVKLRIIAKAQVFGGGQLFDKTVLNAGGNRIGVYVLASAGMARELLARSGEPMELKQVEMAV